MCAAKIARDTRLITSPSAGTILVMIIVTTESAMLASRSVMPQFSVSLMCDFTNGDASVFTAHFRIAGTSGVKIPPTSTTVGSPASACADCAVAVSFVVMIYSQNFFARRPHTRAVEVASVHQPKHRRTAEPSVFAIFFPAAVAVVQQCDKWGRARS